MIKNSFSEKIQVKINSLFYTSYLSLIVGTKGRKSKGESTKKSAYSNRDQIEENFHFNLVSI
ncbi:hypothetical protein BCR26_09810 [Enterococcus rivorum]|uniref:Uncharacterized protein n=1 Tax=Enterococcus rivorum TaxID=762845 RepID=A0A1E5KZQ8_9ENTE|nr:hypothetical protein BCR26_09810 [Enterococcus rivorum]